MPKNLHCWLITETPSFIPPVDWSTFSSLPLFVFHVHLLYCVLLVRHLIIIIIWLRGRCVFVCVLCRLAIDDMPGAHYVY